MEPFEHRRDLGPDLVHPYWTGRARREGRITDEVAVELLVELPKGPPIPDNGDLHQLLDAQLAAPCWAAAFPLMAGGHIGGDLYYEALRRRRGTPAG